MNAITFALISFSAILAGTALGFYLGQRLPKEELTSDSRDSIKMAWGIMATMAALVLSLLLASAKTSFDTINGEMTPSAAKIIVLDRIMAMYGPETAPAREELRQTVAAKIQKMWPSTKTGVTASASLADGSGMENVEKRLNELVLANDVQRAMLVQARPLCTDLLLQRWLVIEQASTAVPSVFFVVLVAWLVMLFIGIGLFAPLNRTVLVTLILCNLSFSAAIFLIDEMNHPLDGMIQVSGAPMVEALKQLGKP